MKDWNTTGWVKAAIIAVLSIHYLFFPLNTQAPAVPGDFIVPFVVGVIIVPIGTKLNFFKLIIEKPHWNDNPLRLRRLLIIFQFLSVMMITFAIVSISSGMIFYATADSMALTMLGSGLGFYGGIWLTIRLSPVKQNKD